MSQGIRPGAEDHRHVTVLQVSAPTEEEGFTAYFEPEGGERFLRPGDHLTITFDTDERPEIDVIWHQDGLVLWRPTRGDLRVSIVDRRSNETVTDLW